MPKLDLQNILQENFVMFVDFHPPTHALSVEFDIVQSNVSKLIKRQGVSNGRLEKLNEITISY